MTFEKLTRHGHRMYASLGGYFWLPCDWCGFEFGGHEKGWKSRPVGTDEPLLCFRCAPNWETGNPRKVPNLTEIRHLAESILHIVNYREQ